jgi:hypothetical protein
MYRVYFKRSHWIERVLFGSSVLLSFNELQTAPWYSTQAISRIERVHEAA